LARVTRSVKISRMPPDPLRALLDAALEGDDRAVGELVVRTQPAVWRLCTVLGSGGDIEDLVQDAYLRALRSMPTYRGDAPVLAWLLRIARNVCADDIRRRQRRRRLLDRLRVLPVEVTDGFGLPVDDLLATLDDDRREAFVLTQMLGMSYEETAEVLDCPIGTVRSRVARARAELFNTVRRSGAV
jgi:RNA polymerase sigma-70 factor (ECF subfamily)